MNLQEFLDFRKFCPVCETQLVTSFHSHRKQTVRNQNNKLEVIFKVEPLPKSSTVFKAGYAFDFTTPGFVVEFYDKNDIHLYDMVHKFYMDRFMELHKNLRTFRFYRDCTYCNQYSYLSTAVEMDFKTSTYGPLTVAFEELGMSKETEEDYQIFRITNVHSLDDFGRRANVSAPFTMLRVCRSSFERKSIRLDMPAESMTVKLPLVSIIDPEAMVDRFSKLLVFA